MTYGLICKTTSGEIQFDSRKQMNSYVVSARGTASSVTVGPDCLVFIKGNSSTTDKVIWGELSGTTYTFKTFDVTTRTTNTVTLDYFVCTPCKDITPEVGDEYGLRVYSPDGTVQFDSRAVKDDKHFRVTDYRTRLTLIGDGSDGDLTTNTTEYVEIKRYSLFSPVNADEYGVSGVLSLTASGTQYKYYGHVRFETVTLLGTFYQVVDATNLKTILIAELT